MNRTTSRLLFASMASFIAMVAAGSAHAQAFYLQEQSVRGQGRAFSGEGADTGVDSIWWNPAAIAGIQGGEGAIHASGILPHGNVVDKGTVVVRPGQTPAAVGGNPVSKNPIKNGLLPSGTIAYGFGKLAIGLALTSPYSFTTDYDNDSWARYDADRTRLRTYDIQPTIAYALTPQISIGGSLNVEYVKASLSNYLPEYSPLQADGHQVLKGKGWDVGWSAGAQFHSGPIAIGVSYKSAIKHDLKGSLQISGVQFPFDSANQDTAAHAKFTTPWQAIGSIRVAATRRLTLNGQVVRAGWSKFSSIDVGDPVNVSIPEEYRNIWTFSGGVDYVVTPKWTVRAGVQHAQTPIRNDNRDARVPDSNRWNFSAGTSYMVARRFTVDAAASYIKFKDAPISAVTAAYPGSAAQTPTVLNGELEDAHAVVLSLGARVGF